MYCEEITYLCGKITNENLEIESGSENAISAMDGILQDNDITNLPDNNNNNNNNNNNKNNNKYQNGS